MIGCLERRSLEKWRGDASSDDVLGSGGLTNFFDKDSVLDLSI